MNRAECSGNASLPMLATLAPRHLRGHGTFQRGLTAALLSLATSCERPPPPGVDCSDHVSCGGVENACEDCLVIPGCGPICIAASEACELSCPAPTQCAILESFPAQIECKDLVPGFGEPAQPALFGCGDAFCSVSQEYCEVVIPGDRLPFENPDVGIARTCRALPTSCVGETSCECLHEETGLDVTQASCNRTPEGGLTLSRRSSEPCTDAGTAPCAEPAITPRR